MSTPAAHTAGPQTGAAEARRETVAELIDRHIATHQDATESRMRDMLVEAERELVTLRADMEDARRLERESSQRVVNAETARGLLDIELQQVRHERSTAVQAADDATSKFATMEERAKTAEDAVSNARCRAQKAERELEMQRSVAESTQRHLDSMEQRMNDVIGRLRDADAEVVLLRDRLHRKESDDQSDTKAVARLTERCESLDSELATALTRCKDAERAVSEQRLDLALARTRVAEVDRERGVFESRISAADQTAAQSRAELAETKRHLTLAEGHLEWADADRSRLLRLWHDADRERLAAVHGRDLLRDRIDAMIAADQGHGTASPTSEPTRDDLLRETELLRAKCAELHFSATWYAESVERSFVESGELHARFEAFQTRIVQAEHRAVQAEAYADTCREHAQQCEAISHGKTKDAAAAQQACDEAKAQWETFKKQTETAQEALIALSAAREAAELREAAALQQEHVTSLRASAAERVAQRAEEDRRSMERRMEDALTIAQHKSEVAREAEIRVSTIDQRIAEWTERVVVAEGRLGAAEADAGTSRLRAESLDEQISMLLNRCGAAEQQAHRADTDRRAAEAHTHTADSEAQEALRRAEETSAAAAESLRLKQTAESHASSMTARAGSAEEEAHRVLVERDMLDERCKGLEQRASTAEAIADHLTHKCKMFESEAVAAQRRAHDIQRLTSAVETDEMSDQRKGFEERLDEAAEQRKALLAEIMKLKKDLVTASTAIEQRSRQVALLRGENSLLKDAIDHGTGGNANAILGSLANRSGPGSVRLPGRSRSGSVADSIHTLGALAGADDTTSIAGSTTFGGDGLGAHLFPQHDDATTLTGVEVNEEAARLLLERLQSSQFMRLLSLRAHEAEVTAVFASRRVSQIQGQLVEYESDTQHSRERDAAVIVSARSADERSKQAVKQLMDCEERLHFIQAAHADLVTAVHRVVRSAEMPQTAAVELLSAAKSSDRDAPEYQPQSSELAGLSAASDVEIATLREEVKGKSDELGAARRQLTVLELQTSEARGSALALERRVAELLASVAETEERLDESNTEASQFRSEAARAERRVGELTEELASSQAHIDTLNGALRDASTTEATLRSQLSAQDNSSNNHTLEIARLHAKVQRSAGAERKALHAVEGSEILAEALEARSGIIAAWARGLAPILRIGYSGFADLLHEQLMDVQATLASRRFVPAPVEPSVEEPAHSSFASAGAAVSAVSTPSMVPSASPGTVFGYRSAGARRAGAPAAAQASDPAAAETESADSEPKADEPAEEVAAMRLEDSNALTVLTDKLRAWLTGATDAVFELAQEAATVSISAAAAVATDAAGESKQEAAEMLSEARLMKLSAANLHAELEDANDAVLMTVRRVRELETTVADLGAQMDDAARRRFDDEQTIAELRRAEAAALRRIEELEDESRELRLQSKKVPMDNLNVRDDAWQRLSDTQRGVLERAASYERVLGELEHRTRVLEKENGDLQRQATQCEKRAAVALESERGALAEIEGLKRDVERRDMQVATANKAIADANEVAKSAREAEAEARSTSTRLQNRIRELEMASKMQRFLADHERRAGSGGADVSNTSDATSGAVPGASPIPATKDQEDAQSASMLREAIQMCTTTTPARPAAPEHSEETGASRGTPLSLGELVAPSKGGQTARALGGSGRVNEVASALSAVAQEVRTFAVRQNEISVARKAAERDAADSENVANLAELRELLMQRATALRQQELGLIEYQTRFKAFEAAVGERLKLLARQERDARFHASIAVESRQDLLRLSDALINQRRKTRRHLQAAEAQLMEKADRSVTCSETQYEAGPTLKSTLVAGIQASPERIRAPIRQADTWLRSTVSQYRTPFVCGFVCLLLVGSLVWLLLTDSEALDL